MSSFSDFYPDPVLGLRLAPEIIVEISFSFIQSICPPIRYLFTFAFNCCIKFIFSWGDGAGLGIYRPYSLSSCFQTRPTGP